MAQNQALLHSDPYLPPFFLNPKKPCILWCLIFRWCHEKEIHEGIWSSVTFSTPEIAGV